MAAKRDAEKDDPNTVFITNTGTKYHRAGCKYLEKSSNPIALKDAVGKYEPCKVRMPPTKVGEGSQEVKEGENLERGARRNNRTLKQWRN